MSSAIKNGGVRQVIPAGTDLVRAAGALEGNSRRLGKFPYQWLKPGPNSQHVLAAGAAAMPGGYGTTSTLLTYTVESGLRFSLRGILLGSTSPDWEEGSGNLIFSVQVGGVGQRPVDWLASVDTRLGSTTNGPWPILGRLEFQAEEVISVLATPIAVITLGAGFNFAKLVGHTYPNFEGGE